MVTRSRIPVFLVFLTILLCGYVLLTGPGSEPSSPEGPEPATTILDEPPTGEDSNPRPDDPSARKISGIVRSAEDGTPIAGTVVHAVPRGRESLRQKAITDAEGRYEFRTFAGGESALFVHGGGVVSPGLASFRWDRASPFLVVIEPGGTATHDLLAEPTGAVEVTAILPDGSPAVGVSPFWSYGAILYGLDYPIAVDEAAGTYRIDGLLPGYEYQIGAKTENHAATYSVTVVSFSGRTAQVTVRLPVPRWIDLQVLDRATGGGIAGATVKLKPRGTYQTGEDGSVRLGPLPPGALEVTASHPEYETLLRRRRLQIAPRKEEAQTINLVRGLAIAGRVRLPDGQAPLDGFVQAETAYGYGGGSADLVDGEFEVTGLRPGRYVLTVEAGYSDAGWWEGTAEAETGDRDVMVELVWGTDKKEIEEVSSGERLLTIRVLDSSGSPVPRASLRLEVIEDGFGWVRGADVLRGRAELRVPEAANEFKVEAFDARTLGRVPLPLGATTIGSLSGDAAELTVTMPEERSISGWVRDGEGNGIPGLVLKALPLLPAPLMKRGEPHRKARSTENGSFRLGGLWEGTYTVQLEVPQGWLGAGIASPVQSGANDLALELIKGATLELTVLDHRGEPVPGTEVGIHVQGADGPFARDLVTEGMVAKGMTDARGQVRLTGLRRDDVYIAFLNPPDHREDLKWAFAPDLRAGVATARLELAHWLIVTLLPGSPDGARVWGRQGYAVEVAAHLGERRYRVGPFHAGEVELVALPKKVNLGLWGGDFAIVSADAGEVELEFPATCNLTIAVKDWPEGGTEEYGRVRFSGSKVMITARRDADGFFRFNYLPLHREVDFLAVPQQGRRLAYRTGIPTNSGECSVPLVAGKSLSGRVVCPPGVVPQKVHASANGFHFSLSAFDEEGGFEFPVVPPGTYQVSATAWDREGDRWLWGKVTAEPGEPVTLRLE